MYFTIVCLFLFFLLDLQKNGKIEFLFFFCCVCVFVLFLILFLYIVYFKVWHIFILWLLFELQTTKHNMALIHAYRGRIYYPNKRYHNSSSTNSFHDNIYLHGSSDLQRFYNCNFYNFISWYHYISYIITLYDKFISIYIIRQDLHLFVYTVPTQLLLISQKGCVWITIIWPWHY